MAKKHLLMLDDRGYILFNQDGTFHVPEMEILTDDDDDREENYENIKDKLGPTATMAVAQS